MPLPEYPPALLHAPAWAGVGLRDRLTQQRERRPPCDWPEDWWQRNYDTLCDDAPPPCPLTGRQLRIPPAPSTRETR